MSYKALLISDNEDVKTIQAMNLVRNKLKINYPNENYSSIIHSFVASHSSWN